MVMRELLLLVAATTAGAFFMPAVRSPALPSRAAIVRQPALAKTSIIMQEAAAEEPTVSAAADAAPESDAGGMMETAVTGAFFALWYLFNIGYNIYNKKALNALPIPYTMATLQLFVGIPYVAVLWATGLRKAPKLSKDNIKTLIPVSLGHLGTHIGAVVSLGAGARAFTKCTRALCWLLVFAAGSRLALSFRSRCVLLRVTL